MYLVLYILTSLILRRYAETQTGANGARFRDWVCLLYSGETMAVERARLDSHVIHGITEAYELTVPWGKRHAAFVRSSLPLAAPPDLAVTPTDSSFEAFSRAVRSHFMQRLALLPVRDPSRHFVERLHAVVYSDSTAQQLLLVYSPTCATFEPAAGAGEPARLEFVQLCLVPNP